MNCCKYKFALFSGKLIIITLSIGSKGYENCIRMKREFQSFHFLPFYRIYCYKIRIVKFYYVSLLPHSVSIRTECDANFNTNTINLIRLQFRFYFMIFTCHFAHKICSKLCCRFARQK